MKFSLISLAVLLSAGLTLAVPNPNGGGDYSMDHGEGHGKDHGESHGKDHGEGHGREYGEGHGRDHGKDHGCYKCEYKRDDCGREYGGYLNPFKCPLLLEAPPTDG